MMERLGRAIEVAVMLLVLLLALAVSAHGQERTRILISDSSKCKAGNKTMIDSVYAAGFPRDWTVAITCSKEDWQRWTDKPDLRIFSKRRITFVFGSVFEDAEAVAMLRKEAGGSPNAQARLASPLRPLQDASH